MKERRNVDQHHVLGIDACKSGWIVSAIKAKQLQIDIFTNFRDIITSFCKAKLIFVDIPIGLPETKKEATYRPEPEVRMLLPKKASSVFTVPCREAAEKKDYDEANKTNKKILEKGMSKQSYYIMNKALEVNEFIRKHSQYKDQIIESHPELQFARFQETKLPIMASKKTNTGLKIREEIIKKLAKFHLNMTTEFQTTELYKRYPDDVLDAICLSLAARIGLERELTTLPQHPKNNAQGIPMKITYCDV